MSYVDIAKNVIRDEINGLEHLSNNLTEEFTTIVEEVIKANGRVAVTGMGKSGIIGKKIVATLASTGTRSFFIHPGEAYHGDLGMIHPSDIVISISNSGETEEVIKLLSFFKDNKNKVIAMCANKESTLGKFSDYFLDISVPKEACPLELAPTTSTTATLALGDALAVALMKARSFKPENFARFHPGGSLGRKLLVKVRDMMRAKNLPIVTEDSTFEEIIVEVSNGRLGAAIVTDSSKKSVKGIVTDGDIRRALQEKKGEVINAKASDFMSGAPVSISPEEKIVVAEELLHEKRITVLVVEENKELVGLLSLHDL